jgi:hypothetical protein
MASVGAEIYYGPGCNTARAGPPTSAKVGPEKIVTCWSDFDFLEYQEEAGPAALQDQLLHEPGKDRLARSTTGCCRTNAATT